MGRWDWKGLMVSSLPPDASEASLTSPGLISGQSAARGLGPGDIKAFQVLYREHCEVGHLGSRQGEGHHAAARPLEHLASPTGHR